jgi:hypothetical protein
MRGRSLVVLQIFILSCLLHGGCSRLFGEEGDSLPKEKTRQSIAISSETRDTPQGSQKSELSKLCHHALIALAIFICSVLLTIAQFAWYNREGNKSLLLATMWRNRLFRR